MVKLTQWSEDHLNNWIMIWLRKSRKRPYATKRPAPAILWGEVSFYDHLPQQLYARDMNLYFTFAEGIRGIGDHVIDTGMIYSIRKGRKKYTLVFIDKTMRNWGYKCAPRG